MRYLLRLVLLISPFISGVVSAHPHSWIDLKTHVQGTQTHITGFRMEWTFDAMSSAYMLDGEDLSAEHIDATLQKVADELLENMLAEHYFTYFYDAGKPIRYKVAKNAKLSVNRAKAVLSFDLPLVMPQPITAPEVSLLIFEPSYYVDMSWKRTKDVTLSEELAKHCSLEVVEPNPTAEQMNYAMSLPMDADPDNALGQLFTQKVLFHCANSVASAGGSGE